MQNAGNPSGGGLLVQCNPGTGTQILVACDNTDSCNSSNFTFPDYNYILRDYQVESFGLSSAVTITTSNSATVSASATAASSGSSSSSTTSLQPVSTAPSTTCAGEGPLQAAVQTEQQKVVAVGAGVGVPLGVLFLSFLALFLLERRKRRGTSGKDSHYKAQPLGIRPGPQQRNSQHRWRAEMDEDRAKHELGGDGARSELASGLATHQAE